MSSTSIKLPSQSQSTEATERTMDSKSEQSATLDLEWILSLDDKRKTNRRGSFLSNADVPRRSIIEHNKIIDYLRTQGFTLGLARTLVQNTDSFPVRIWLVNNASTMNHTDGHVVVQSQEPPFSTKNVDCTRWEEVSNTLHWHADFSARMEAPMAIRLLSGTSPNQLGVATSPLVLREEEVTRLAEVLKNKPEGQGKLILHLREVVNAIKAVPREKLEHRSIAIVYVTDSLPTGENGEVGDVAAAEFLHILQELEGLPVWFVVRLSTDEKSVVDFYSELDNIIVSVERSEHVTQNSGLHLDVLDDYLSEAKDVFKYNPWLNYAYPLHLCRESAVNFPVFDTLNDRPLTHGELAKFICLLFDRRTQAFMEQPLPNPVTEYKAFREEVLLLLQKNGKLWNPIKKRIMPWIDVKVMDQIFGAGATTTCACTLM